MALTMFHWYGTFQDFYEFGKNPNFLILKTLSAISEYDVTKNIFANSYPWFFPEGIGDMYDMTRGKVSIKDWGNHLLQYYDGRFLQDSLFGLFLYNTIQRHSSNSEGNFFLSSDRFIGRNPPTIEDLQRQVMQKNCRYISMLRYFESRGIMA